MKLISTFCLVLLAMTAAAFAQTATLPAQSAAEQAGAKPLPLKILSYNIHHAEGVDGKLDLPRIAQVIRQSGADVVALQEVDQRVQRSGGVDQPQELAAALGMHAVFGGNITLQGGNYGNAVLSRYPIQAHQNHLLPNDNGGEQRGVLEVDIQLPGGQVLTLLATHFDHRPDPAQRIASAKFINQTFGKDTTRLMCLAGDLNAVPDTRELQELQKLWQLPAGQQGATIPVAQPTRKIDYVLPFAASADAAWTLHELRSQVLAEAVASDHRPLLSEAEVRPQPAPLPNSQSQKTQTQDVQPAAAGPPNVLLICVDDLRPELNCYGVDYIRSPHIDRLAASGSLFQRHYVQAPTCGASRYALLTGCYGGRDNDALFRRAARIADGQEVTTPSMPEWFRTHGYRTVSVGKVSHHPGGRGGPDWNDDRQPEMPAAWDRHLCPPGAWQHPRGWMHGLANGEIRSNAKGMDVFQSAPGGDEIYPDGVSTEEALGQLRELSAAPQQPFFLAVGILRPHLPFGAPAKYMEAYHAAKLPPIAHPHKPAGHTTWHGSGEFMKYNRWGRDPNEDGEFATLVRKHYAACVSYADALVGRLLQQLADSPAADNTIVVLWGDHGWHLGEHAIWGKHSLFEESLRSPLIISLPHKLRQQTQPAKVDAIVETVDLFPTLCELSGLPAPEFADGQSLRALLQGQTLEPQTAVSYFRQARSLRSDRYRLIVHRDGQRELYDHQRPDGETLNLADELPQVCAELEQTLNSRYPEGE